MKWFVESPVLYFRLLERSVSRTRSVTYSNSHPTCCSASLRNRQLLAASLCLDLCRGEAPRISRRDHCRTEEGELCQTEGSERESDTATRGDFTPRLPECKHLSESWQRALRVRLAQARRVVFPRSLANLSGEGPVRPRSRSYLQYQHKIKCRQHRVRTNTRGC